MANQFDEFHVMEYTTRVEHLLQQMGSRLMVGAEVRGFKSRQSQVIAQYGEVAAAAVNNGGNNSHDTTVITTTPMDSRWVVPADWGVADVVDREDLIRSLIDPKSGIAQAHAAAIGRRQDLSIIAAFDGNAQTGIDGGTATSFAADGGQSIATGGDGLTMDKLRETKKLLMEADVDVDRDQLFFAITASEHDGLLKQTQLVSLDYNTRPVLVDGRINAFMGFNFIHTELLTKTGGGGADTECFAWAKSGLSFGSWGGIVAEVTQRADLWNSWQIATRGTFNATRTQGGKFVQIDCAR